MSKYDPQLACMWVGGPLTRIAHLSLSSAVAQGYKPRIYLYDMNTRVPRGVERCDARTIVKENSVFLRQGRYANFSDLFRYELLSKHDLIWFDLDCIFLDGGFPFDKPYIFTHETEEPFTIATGILKYPKDSSFSNLLLDECRSLIPRLKASDSQEHGWGAIGPLLITKSVLKCNLLNHALPKEALFPIMFNKDDLQFFIDPNLCADALDRIKTAKSSIIHVWASALSMNGIVVENTSYSHFPSGSLLDYYDKKFRIDRVW